MEPALFINSWAAEDAVARCRIKHCRVRAKQSRGQTLGWVISMVRQGFETILTESDYEARLRKYS